MNDDQIQLEFEDDDAAKAVPLWKREFPRWSEIKGPANKPGPYFKDDAIEEAKQAHVEQSADA